MTTKNITYTCRCICGWRSRRRIDPDAAIQHGEDHLATLSDRSGHCTLLDRT